MNSTLKQSVRLIKSFCLCNQHSLQVICLRGFTGSYIFRKENNVNTSSAEVLKERASNKSEHTWVGPPHPVSNLRLKVFPTSKHLTKEEVHFYEKSQETQEWNQQYWELHNKDFERSRKLYMEEISKRKNLDSKNCPTPEDMATFYKEFLDKNYEKHISYNWKWYKRNFELLYLSAIAEVSKLRKLLKKDVP